MEWNQDIILEFLDLYKEEPVLWDPKHKNYNSKKCVHEAWKRIQNSLRHQRSLPDLKAKKNLLMSTYRKLALKVKSSEKKERVYKPEWFAYDKMASFLESVYRPRRNLRGVVGEEDDRVDNDTETSYLNKSSRIFTACEVEVNGDAKNAVDQNGLQLNEKQLAERKIRLIEKRMDEAYNFLRQVSAKPKVVKDESYKFCELLCCTLRSLDAESRNLLTYQINQLVHYFNNWRKSQQNFQYPNYEQSVLHALPVQIPTTSSTHQIPTTSSTHQIPTTSSTHQNGSKDPHSERICKKFAVVSIPDEEHSLVIVASSWLEKTEDTDFHICSWPPFVTEARVKLAVLENMTPISTWSKCNARLIKHCSTYASAEKLMEAIVIVSNCRSEFLLERKLKEIKKEQNTFPSRISFNSSTGSYSPTQSGPIICGVNANVDESCLQNGLSTSSIENNRRNSLRNQTGSFVGDLSRFREVQIS